MVGYLEDVQNWALRGTTVRSEDFERYLGPQSLRTWHCLAAMWAGQPPPPD